MSNHPITRTGTALLLTVLLGSLSGTFPVLAQTNFSRNRVVVNQSVIPAGTVIPVSYDKADKILVAKTDVIPLALTVSSNIQDRNGSIVIPIGSEVLGQLEYTGRGVQFFAQEIRLNNGRIIPLNASSRVVTRTETIRKGASTQDILTGTLAGAGAATLISGLTGDRQISALDVLAGAAVGTLAGWGLPTSGVLGGSSSELYAVNPDRDLNLTLQSDLNTRRPDRVGRY